MNGAELTREVESLREQQQAVGDVLRAMARSEGFEPVCRAIVDGATRLSAGHHGAMYLADGDVFRAVVLGGGPPDQLEWEQAHPHARDRTTLAGRRRRDG